MYLLIMRLILSTVGGSYGRTLWPNKK